MDFSDIPDELSKLLQAEEILITKIHVAIEIRHGRSAQYRYTDHISTVCCPSCLLNLTLSSCRPTMPSQAKGRMNSSTYAREGGAS